MLRLFVHLLTCVVFAAALSACASRPRQVPEIQQVYEIRAVVVTANEGVPRPLLRNIKLGMDRAIKGNVRPVPLPRAVMSIHVVNVGREPAGDGLRTQTELSVTLTDVPSGQPVLVRSFLVYSFSLDKRGADASAAEAITSRLRVEYALLQPSIRRPPVYVAPRLSTRMATDVEPVVVKVNRPIVIPLKSAPVIGADQDPLLNSKTRIAPEDTVKPAKAVVDDTTPKKIEKAVPAENALESGAAAKVVIMPKPADTNADEPCVETLEKKC